MKIARQIGETHDGQGLRQPLRDQVHHGRAGGPGAHPQAPGGVADLEARHPLQQVERLVDHELIEPFDVADVERLPESQALPDGLPCLGWNGRRELRRGVIGREVEQREDDEADGQQRGDGEEQTSGHIP